MWRSLLQQPPPPPELVPPPPPHWENSSPDMYLGGAGDTNGESSHLSSSEVHYQLPQHQSPAGVAVEQAILLERFKAQAQWHEAEHHRASEKHNKLLRDTEAAREETACLHALLAKRDQELVDLAKKASAVAMEEKEARQRERTTLEDALAQERGRAERLEQEKARMGYQIQARENELLALSHEARDVKQALADAESSARQLREEQRIRKEDSAMMLGADQLHQTTKSLQRAQHTRRALHGIFANVQGALEQFRRHEMLGDLNKRLVETTVAVGTSAINVPPGWEDLAQDLRQLLGNVAALCPRLLDELEAGKRESEVLSTELEELLAKVQKSNVTGGGVPVQSTMLPVEKKLQFVDHVADETAHLLRGMARSHLQSVRSQLRTTEAQQSDLVLEAQECKRQAARRAAEAAEALQVRLRAEEERAKAETAMEVAVVQRDTLELTVAAQEAQLQEQQQKLDVVTHEVALLREEGKHLRGALAQAHEDQARLEAAHMTQERALQQTNMGLTQAKEENERLLDRLQEAEAAVETGQYREADALERLGVATEEIQRYASRLADEEARANWVEESMLAILNKLQTKQQTTVLWHAWRHDTATAKARQLQGLLEATQAKLATAQFNHQAAEAKWQEEVEAGERLADACASALGRRRQEDKARAALYAWRRRARELTHSRRDLHNYLKQFVLRRRVAAAHEVARLLDGRIQDFSRALEETIVEKKTESETAQLELAEARAQNLAKDGHLRTLEEELVSLRGQVAASQGLEEQLVAREGEVADLRAMLVTLKDLKREMDAEERRVQENEDDGEEEQGNSSPAAAGGGGGRRGSKMTAYLVVRARRAEHEKHEIAQQLAEAREDVRRLSREVEEMVATMQWGLTTDGHGALLPAGEDLRAHAQATLTHQLERAHEMLAALEGQLDQTRQEANGMERQLVEALEDVSTLEEHLAAQMESAGLQQTELERLREASATREERLLSLSRRIGSLETERKEAHTRFVEALGQGGGEGGSGENEPCAEGRQQLLVEEVGRLQQALEVSEQDRLNLEQQLADVLKEREELFELCHLLRNELQAAAGTMRDTAAVAAVETSFSSLHFQPQDVALSPPRRQQLQQLQREIAAQSAQALHQAVQRSQERLDILLQEGNQVTEGLAAAVGDKKKKGGGGHHQHHYHHHHHRRRETLSPPSISSSSSGKEERKRSKKSKKDKTKKVEKHRSSNCNQRIEAEEEEEEGCFGKRKDDADDGRQELRVLIQSTQEEVDAAAGKRQRANRALVEYLNSLKASLRCLERGGEERRGEDGGEEEEEEEGGDQ